VECGGRANTGDDPTHVEQKLQQKQAILVPGALAVRVITGLSFEAIYVTGAGMTNMSLGLPDLSFVDLTQIGQHTMAIRRRSRRPRP
jgi:2-methylisocitrate lyase-like PEP mutase family enzyme